MSELKMVNFVFLYFFLIFIFIFNLFSYFKLRDKSYNHIIICYIEECRRFQNNNIIQHVHHILTLWIIHGLENRLDKISYKPTSYI